MKLFNIWIRDRNNDWTLIAYRVGRVVMMAYRETCIQPTRIEVVK